MHGSDKVSESTKGKKAMAQSKNIGKPLSADDRKLIERSTGQEVGKNGARVSVHNGWIQCQPGDTVTINDWPFDASVFIQQLGGNDRDVEVAVWTTDANGRLVNRVYLNSSRDDESQVELTKLKPHTHNIYFDPVPYSGGVRCSSTRYSVVTITGVNPFELLPAPVAFWHIGQGLLQVLLPWYEAIEIGEAEERIEALYGQYGVDNVPFLRSQPPRMPGSLILSGSQKPETARILYDGFSTLDIDSDVLIYLRQY